MKWDLEERTEDAVVAYLKVAIAGSIRVSAAWERDEMEYPAAVVHAGETEPLSEPAEWHDGRMIKVEVAVVTEGVDELDPDDGSVVRTARERNAIARSAVMDALFVSDLTQQLINQGVEAIAFSYAQYATTTREVDGRNLVTTIAGIITAEPVSGS